MEIKSRRTTADTKEIVRSIPAYLSGRKTDEHGLAEAFWSAVAASLYRSIYNAFLLKSFGLTDDLGNSWKDLDRKTKAYSRPDIRKTLNLPNHNPKRPSLTKKQDEVWKAIYRKSSASRFRSIARNADSLLASASNQRTANRLNNLISAARAASARLAWSTLKKKFWAQTVADLAEFKTAPINMQSGELSESLRPSPTQTGQAYYPRPNQLFRIEGKTLVLGSSLPYANKQHHRRRFWPEPEEMGPWLSAALSEGRDALKKRLVKALA